MNALNVRLCVHLDMGGNNMGKYVGERIREARKSAKMSQGELAQGVRVRRQTIGEYENGGERKSPENRFIRSLGFDS